MHARRDAGAVALEALPCGVNALARGPGAADPLVLELAAAGDGLVLELVDSILVVDASSNCENMAGQELSLGNQSVGRLLRDADDLNGGWSLDAGVAKLDVHELDAGHDLELLFDAAPSLDGVLKDHLGVVVGHALVREQQLHEAAEGLPDAVLVTGVEIAVQAEELVQVMGVVALPHALAELGEAVGDEPDVPREDVAAHFGDLPAGEVAVDAVEEGAVVVEFGWERVEQVRCLEDVVHRVVDVALEHHGGVGGEALAAAVVGAVGHVALHDLDGVLVLEVHSRDLVEGDAVPVAYQARAVHRGGLGLACAEASKEARGRGLAAADQCGVGADLGVDVALARAAGTELAQVVVSLGQGHHALEEVHLLPLLEDGRLVAGAPQKEVHLLLGCEQLALLDEGIQVHVRHLDWGDARDLDGIVLWAAAVALRSRGVHQLAERILEVILRIVVLELHDGPDASGEHLGVLADDLLGDGQLAYGEVREGGEVYALELVEAGLELVDDGVAAQIGDLVFDELGLVGAHVVLREDLPDPLKAFLDRLGVPGGAVHAEQVLDDVCRDVCGPLHESRQVLPDRAACEHLHNLAV